MLDNKKIRGCSLLVATDARVWSPFGGRYIRFKGLISALYRSGVELDFVTSRHLNPEDIARLREIGFSRVAGGDVDTKSPRKPTLRMHLRGICPEPVAALLRVVRRWLRDKIQVNAANKVEAQTLSTVECPVLTRMTTDHVNRKAYDFVLMEYVKHGSALAPLRELPKHMRPISMIDTHDVFHERCAALERHGIPQSIRASREDEQSILEEFDIIIAIQDEDRQKFEGMCPSATVLTCLPPYVANPVEPSKAYREKSLAYFAGSGKAGPNRLGLLEFLDQAWPLIRHEHPTAVLSVFGSIRDAFDGKSYPGVCFEGYVPDLREAYSRAELIIAPITFGSGLKVKVLEALSYGRPVVATTHSAIGYPDSGGHGLLVSHDWHSFAALVNGVFSQPGRAVEEGRRAAAYVDKYFSETRVMKDLLDSMESHLERRRSLSRMKPLSE